MTRRDEIIHTQERECGAATQPGFKPNRTSGFERLGGGGGGRGVEWNTGDIAQDQWQS